MTDDSWALEMRSVSAHPRGRDIGITDISLTVAPGEIFCLLGGSRAGKSLVVDLAMGLVPASSGVIRVCGVDVAAAPVEARACLTFVNADGPLRHTLSVSRNMSFFARLAHARPAADVDGDRVDALRDVGLPDRTLRRRVGDLSKGEVLLVWIAIARLRQSKLVILDDPTQGLDVDWVSIVQAQISALRSSGAGILLVTSAALFASQVADCVSLIQSGRMTMRRTREQVLAMNIGQVSVEFQGEVRDPRTPTRLPTGRRGGVW